MKNKPKFTYYALCGVAFNLCQFAIPKMEDTHRFYLTLLLLFICILIYLCRLVRYCNWAENKIVELNTTVQDTKEELRKLNQKHQNLKFHIKKKEKHIDAYNDISYNFINNLNFLILKCHGEKKDNFQSVLQMYQQMKNEKLQQFDRKDVTYEENSNN